MIKRGSVVFAVREDWFRAEMSLISLNKTRHISFGPAFHRTAIGFGFSLNTVSQGTKVL